MAGPRRKRHLMGEINVVPYIDVMLVLLIIFMVTAPLLTQGVKVELPKAGGEPLPVKDRREEPPLVLSVDAQGRYFLNIGATPNQPVSEDLLVARAAALLRRSPEVDVLVKGDTAVPYGRIVSAMVLLQKAGARKVGFLTDPTPRREDRSP